AGTATYTGSGVGIGLNGGSILDNLAGATFDAQGITSFAPGAGAGRTVNNARTFLKSAGVITGVGSGVAFNNRGWVQVQSGFLEFQGGGTASGSFSVAAGSTLYFDSFYTLDAASSVTGVGRVIFGGRTINVTGTYDVTGSTEVFGAWATANFTGTVV